MKKMEYSTHLSGSQIVDKTHAQIELRGRLDSLSAALVELQINALRDGYEELVPELDEVQEKISELLICEVTGKKCGDLVLWGLDAEEIRRRSHYPLDYFGIGHIRPHHSMGGTASALNLFRTKVRETELCACRAFSIKEDEGFDREDIIKTLNRLSSAIYILTYKYLPKGFDKTIELRKG